MVLKSHSSNPFNYLLTISEGFFLLQSLMCYLLICVCIYIRVVGEQPFFNTYFIEQNAVFSINKLFFLTSLWNLYCYLKGLGVVRY